MDYASVVRDFCSDVSEDDCLITTLDRFESKLVEQLLIVEHDNTGKFEYLIDNFHRDNSQNTVCIGTLNNYASKSVEQLCEPQVIADNKQTGEFVVENFYRDNSKDIICIGALNNFKTNDGASGTSALVKHVEIIELNDDTVIFLDEPSHDIIIPHDSADKTTDQVIILHDSSYGFPCEAESKAKEATPSRNSMITDLKRETNQLLAELDADYAREEALRVFGKFFCCLL